MGDVVKLHSPIVSSEILPRVQITTSNTNKSYGIVVGGDLDGIYGDGVDTGEDFRATTSAGQGAVVVTQGRCLARVETTSGNIAVGELLVASDNTNGVLKQLEANDEHVIAIALQASTSSSSFDIMAVDVQREGINNFS